jgi:hypothetical protein
MNHLSTQGNRLIFVFFFAVSCALVGCESDDGYVAGSTDDAATSTDAAAANPTDADATVDLKDAPAMQAADASAKDTLVAADAFVTDGRVTSDAGGDTGLLAPECDIYDPLSCPSSNMKCDLARHPVSEERYLACRTSGAGKVGEVCTGGSQCGRGLVCIKVGATTNCRQVCDATDGVPACSVSGQTCAGRSATYGVTFCL